MTLYDLGPRRPTHRPADPPVTVRMDGDHVIIRTAGQLDRDATNALAETINGAITAGCVVVLDLHSLDRAAPFASQQRSLGAVDPALPPSTSRWSVESVASGVLRVPTAAQPWTINLKSQRLCTGDVATEWRFAPASAWIAVASIIISPRAITAITTRGHDVGASVIRPHVEARGEDRA